MILKILILAAIQGAAELLPVSSSAHVIIAEKLMGLNPTSPQMTLLLVMLHTGTMFAVILYFWKSWKSSFFSSREKFFEAAKYIIIATAFTGVIGLALKYFIEKYMLRGIPHAQIELIFGNMTLISVSLAAVGVMIILAGLVKKRSGKIKRLGLRESSLIGAVQGLCLPFRGFSRSGATISAGLLLNMAKDKTEEFSFALAVVLTPPVVVREVWRLLKAKDASSLASINFSIFYPSLVGMVFSFISGLLALVWLSNWLEKGKWQVFGFYCIFFSAVVFILHRAGF
ncbi:MAG: undecaprenyl-diphosphate phosphatase [Nitrospirota bacterium]